MQLKAFLLSKVTRNFQGTDYSKLMVMLPDGKVGSIRCPLDLSVDEFVKKDCTITLETAISQNQVIVKAVSIAK